MSKTKIVLFRIKFIDLYKVPLEGLYHIVTINGRTACSGESIEGGHTVWISKPAGTRFNVSIKDPRNGSMIDILKDLIVPLNITTFEAHAPFAKHKFKLKMFEGSTGNYLRKTHTVITEETLSSIAKIYGIQWQKIAQLNNLKEPYTIRPKDVLKLPPTKARQQTSTNSSSQTSSKGDDLSLKTEHTVAKNETLSGISQRSGVSVEQLKRMNGITDPTTLQSGQTIKLRGDGSAKSHKTPKPTSASNTNSSKEEKGFFDGVADDFESIGQSIKEGFEDFNNAVSGTKEGESADSPRPFENQANSTKSNQTYEVKSGDTLGKIAQQHGIKTNDLANANGLNLTDTIHPGDKLKIPNGNSTSSSQSQTTPTQPSIPVDTQTSDDRGQTGTPKVDVTKLGDCSCNRDLTLSELENMIRQLSGKNEIKLFDHKNCTLNTAERNTQSLLTELNKVFKKYDINTCIRRIHFLAQTYHESAEFTTTTEFSDGTKYNPGGSKNKTGKKNGNTTMGDGPKYRGRGLMQLTWKNNYKYYKAFSDTDVVTNFRFVSTSLAIGADAAGWFWKQGKELSKGKRWTGPLEHWKPDFIKDEEIDYPKTKISTADSTYYTIDMNLIADKDVVDLISYLINGGDNGKDDRRKNVTTLKSFFKYPSKCVSTGVEKPKIEQASSGIAPWMEIAIREGKQWRNQPESEIDDKDNYFDYIDVPTAVPKPGFFDQMTSTSWCAAFINYCLLETGFNMVDVSSGWGKVRANGFRLDKVNFIKIDKPIYGAIACYMQNSNHSSHVALVIATHPNGTHFYRFGGNQNQHLSIDIRPINQYEFYVPTVYSSTAETQENAPQKSEADMKAMGITWHGWKAGSTR